MASQYNTASLITLLMALSLSQAATERFYIKTSPSQPCPSGYVAGRCLTLQQYIDNSTSGNVYTTDQVFLELQTGNHDAIIESRIRVQSMTSFQIQGVDATVNCKHANRSGFMSFDNVNSITVSGIIFTNCRSMNFDSVPALMIRDCGFRESGGLILFQVRKSMVMNSTFQHGHGLQLLRSSSVIISSLFLNLTTIDEPTPDSLLCSRYSEDVRRGGGAVFSFESIITVDRCTFSRNTILCEGGGAILSENSRLKITNSSFTENTASLIGGAIYAYGNVTEIYSSSFSFNLVTGLSRNLQAVLSKGGGAIFVSSSLSQILIDGTIFNANNATSGGALFMYGNDIIISVRGSRFVENSAIDRDGKGGAIYYSGQRATVRVLKSVFENNIASMCATIRLEDPTNTTEITALNNEFINNTANETGGFACLSGNYTTPARSTAAPATTITNAIVSTTGSATVSKNEDMFTTAARVSDKNTNIAMTALILVVILSFLVAILYFLVTIITLLLRSMIKGKTGKVNNHNVYVPMVENKNNSDNQNT